MLGGERVEADTLNKGEFAYMHYCRMCHGVHGNGMSDQNGLLTEGKARDFTSGVFLYSSNGPGTLPTDADLARVITNGIPNSAMKPLRISDDERNAVIQYIKTFSPRWREAK